MAYKWIKDGLMVQRLADSACIPNEALNADWIEFQSWVAQGNAPAPADPHLADAAPRREQLIEQARASIDALPEAQRAPFRMLLDLL